jgi:hypothetical protein
MSNRTFASYLLGLFVIQFIAMHALTIYRFKSFDTNIMINSFPLLTLSSVICLGYSLFLLFKDGRP